MLLRSLLVIMVFITTLSAAVIEPVTAEKPELKPLSSLTKQEIRSLSRNQMEKYMGRSMTGMEKLAFGLHKKKFVKYTRMHEEGKMNTMAVLALATSWIPGLGVIFGIIGLSQIKKRKERGSAGWLGQAS